ncbi:uncharacterized protein PG986_006359 [Apiospora aurea]|uniref:Knr4/Smi1-like domain-containing protein n=1 Tax=Apiospora aurea TaxID=335848 RepID=A0ABR1QK74_9PEZI
MESTMEALDIPARQKAKLHRVADLLLVIYQTLVEMRYLEPDEVQPGPHDVSALVPLYESLGLAPAVVYLYSILPYVRLHQDRQHETPFFLGGDFADFRNKADVERGRDPIYNSPEGDDWRADNGPYMRPWYTALSHCGWRRCVIVYDTRSDEICIVHMGGGWCADPNIQNRWVDKEEAEREDEEEDGDDEGCVATTQETDGGDANADEPDEHGEEGDDGSDNDSGVSGLEEEESGHEDEEDEDEEEDDGMIEEEGMVIGYDSRSAAAVLRDINRWYREHATPFLGLGQDGPWIDEDKEHDVPISTLYKQHGWPGPDFDGDAFEVSLARRHAAARAKPDPDQPRRQAESDRYMLDQADQSIERHRTGVASAETADEEWAARWELFHAERAREGWVRKLRENEERCEREFPGGEWLRKADLPLLEYERLRQEVQYEEKRRKEKREQEQEQKQEEKEAEQQLTDINGDVEEPPRKKRRCDLTSLPHEARRATLLRRAMDASRADAERLCGAARVAASDEAFCRPQAAREEGEASVRRKREGLASFEEDLEVFRRWAADLPPGTAATRDQVEALIAWTEEQRDVAQELVSKAEKWFAENFGADEGGSDGKGA